MTDTKKHGPAPPTRKQPRRAAAAKTTADSAPSEPATPRVLGGGGVRKSEGKGRATAASASTRSNAAKLRSALLRRVDVRDESAAYREQAALLGLIGAAGAVEEGVAGRKKGKGARRVPRAKRYMDDDEDFNGGTGGGGGGGEDFDEDDDDDDGDAAVAAFAEGGDFYHDDRRRRPDLRRGRRWIPDIGRRGPRPAQRPPGVPHTLWMAYAHLDDFVYRHSLAPAEVEALPLLDDVIEYQNSDGRSPRPVTPPGHRWDDHLELVPIEEGDALGGGKSS
ncbi:hypothetical protein SAMD00023353_1801610 [Rosellinia necatrix]|uniref:Uncharacterized protein n=1 Tax=Rosellinia necatrix TaxID=77044 RepID=A0A1W2TE28_ROSNE|nr:hypothetical protein SAMD00023353_1801610 [Rosellinia necatrix]